MLDTHHKIQRKILQDLLFIDRLKYSELKPANMEGSQFTFHLQKLIESGLVVKDSGMYSLTAIGKNSANTFDQDSTFPKMQAKHSVVFCAFRKKDSALQTLIYTRKKNPFFDHQGYPTGKVMYGESIISTAERELCEETGLVGKANLIGIRHFRIFYPTPSDLVEDKVMYICKIDEPTGELSSNDEGEFQWIDIENAKSIVVNPLPEFQEVFDMLMSFKGNITFGETEFYPDQF